MSLKRFFILSILSCFVLSVFSCNEDEEETNVKFEWNYVKRKMQIEGTDTSWVVDTSVRYFVDKYSIVKDSNTMKIMGHTTSNDSIVIDFENNGSGLSAATVTVGEYTVGGNDKYSLTFFKEELPLICVNGYATINYINSRVDIEFYSKLSNGYALENGIAENLDVYLEPDTTGGL